MFNLFDINWWTIFKTLYLYWCIYFIFIFICIFNIIFKS